MREPTVWDVLEDLGLDVVFNVTLDFNHSKFLVLLVDANLLGSREKRERRVWREREKRRAKELERDI